MKSYIKQAIKELKSGKKLTIEVKLKNKNDYKRPVKGLYNRFIYKVTGKIPPNFFKLFLLRTTGLNIGKDVCIPMYNEYDPYFAELITVKDGALLGGSSKIFSHKVVGNKLILGKITVEERVLVGGMAILWPGSYVHKHSIIGLNAEVVTVVPEGTLYGGAPAKEVMKFDKESMKKYFGESSKDNNYYKDARKKIKEFIADKSKNIFMLPYNGKRLNAGLDWWRARNVFRIFIDGAIIEFANFMPNFLKIWLFRLVGVKVGKNVRFGKGSVPDHIYPDLVEIGDNTTIGKDCYLDAHEYTITLTRFGRTRLGKHVKVGDNVLLRSGVQIGNNVTIKDDSTIMKDVPAGETWAGSPAKKVE